MKTKKMCSKWWVVIAVFLMVVSGIGASFIQTSGYTVTVKNLKWETTKGFALAGKLFVPEGVTAENPAPAIVASHGMFNDKEMQDAFFVELSRRGYVVLATDMPSHGESDETDTIEGCLVGVIEGVKHLASLPYVDKDNIGITGHSLGALNCNIAVLEDNASETPLIKTVLLNCNDGFYTDEAGNFVNIYGSRSVGIVAAQYDEFFMTDVDENGNKTATRDFVQYNNAQSFLHFGKDPAGLEKREASVFYTEEVNGVSCDRIIYSINMLHPWSHFSKTSVAATIEYFERTIGAPNPIAKDNQVWQVKEAFNLLGLIGFFIFIVNFAIILANTRFFNLNRRIEELPVQKFDRKKGIEFFGSLLLTVCFGAITYLPIMNGVEAFMKDNSSWAQSSVFGIGLWAFACGVFAIALMVIPFAFNKDKASIEKIKDLKMSLPQILKTILLAIITVTAGYLCVSMVKYFFGTDFRIWILAVKPFASKLLLLSLCPYMLLFLVYYVANSVSTGIFMNNPIGVKNGKGYWINTCILAITNVLPVIILLGIQYICYVSTGYMAWTDPGSMYIVWMFPMVVFLPLAAVISKKIYRATRNPYLAGIINGIIVTLVSCSNTLTWAK